MATKATPAPTLAPPPGATLFASPIDDPAVCYFTDPRVSVAYGTFVGDFATVADPDERAWLVANGWAYDRTSGPLPGAYHVGNPGEWTGYPPPAPIPPPPEPAPSPPAVRR